MADCFVNPVFRRELLRVLSRGEATNALKRLIYIGRVANYQAIFDRWAQRRSGAIPSEMIARIAPTRTEGINMRGVFRFPIEQCADPPPEE